MTQTEIRQGFNQMIAAASSAGNNQDAVARMELAREFFANPTFKAALQDHVWQANQAGK